MYKRDGIMRAVVSAGLGIALVLQPVANALAEGSSQDPGLPAGEYASPDYADAAAANKESTGDTRLYVTSKKDALTASEGSVDSQMRVSVPVAIHYVADTTGSLVGPSNDTVKFVNNTPLGTVHVSGIQVDSSPNVEIVNYSAGMTDGQMSFAVRPVSKEAGEGAAPSQGTIDQLGNYAAEKGGSPIKKNEWNIPGSGGTLALNDLTGFIKGFGAISPDTDTQVGVVHWTVRLGTREHADEIDRSVTLRYHLNGGTLPEGVTLEDYPIDVMTIDGEGNTIPNEVRLNAPVATTQQQQIIPPSQTATDGTREEMKLVGWSLTPDGSTPVKMLKDIGTLESLAGTVQNLYAIYAPVS
jgi:hypothetical protein